MIVYMATNRSNGKNYIGQTVGTLSSRINKHNCYARNGSSVHFHNAIKKHGIDNFKWEVLRICNNVNELNAFEQYYIALYDSMNRDFGYNLTAGGEGMIGWHHSDETKAKMSKWRTGIKYSETTRQKISIATSGKNNWCYGKHLSKEHKEKIRQANLGKHHSDESKNKMSATRIERKLAEGKNNSMYGKYHSAKSKEKMSIAHLNMSDETKAKMSKAKLKYYKNKRKTNNENTVST